MLLLYAGYDILGITVALGNSWVESESMHILRFLEVSPSWSVLCMEDEPRD